MEHDEFILHLEQMKKPDPELPVHARRLRLTFLDARTCARWSVALVILPAVFVSVNVLKYWIGLSFLPDLGSLVPEFARDRIMNDVLPFVLLGMGATAILLNTMSVLHVDVSSMPHTWIVTVGIKKHRMNLSILAVAVVALLVLLTYAVLENL